MALSIEGEPVSDAAETLVAYGAAHVAALAVIAVVAVVVVWVVRARRRAVGSSVARGVCRALAAVLLVNMVFEQCFLAGTGRWSLAESLPLHLCDLAVFAAIAALLIATRASVLAHATPAAFEVVYYWGLAGAMQALLTPSVGQSFPGPLFFTYFTAHGCTVVAVLVLIFGLRLRPRRGSGLRVWLLTNLVAVPVLACDWLVGANYMYLRGPAEAPSVLDYLGAWPWPFLVSLDLLVAVCIARCYAPWWWVARRSGT